MVPKLDFGSNQAADVSAVSYKEVEEWQTKIERHIKVKVKPLHERHVTLASSTLQQSNEKDKRIQNHTGWSFKLHKRHQTAYQPES